MLPFCLYLLRKDPRRSTEITSGLKSCLKQAVRRSEPHASSQTTTWSFYVPLRTKKIFQSALQSPRAFCLFSDIYVYVCIRIHRLLEVFLNYFFYLHSLCFINTGTHKILHIYPHTLLANLRRDSQRSEAGPASAQPIVISADNLMALCVCCSSLCLHIEFSGSVVYCVFTEPTSCQQCARPSPPKQLSVSTPFFTFTPSSYFL